MSIEFKKVSYTYFGASKNDFEEALTDICLKVNATNEFIVICGKTGSGKSTLMQHMNALLTPTKGEIQIFDKVIKAKKNRNLNSIRKRIGLVFQFPEYQLFEETILKDVAFGPKNFGFKLEEAYQMAEAALKLVGIPENLYHVSPFKISGGQMRKVSIAGVLASNSDILILDEPTRGLDPKGSLEIMKIFKDLKENHKKTIIMITHDMNLLYDYATRVIVMKDGKIVYDGDKLELFKEEKYLRFALDKPDILKEIDFINQELNLDIPYNINNVETLVKLLESELN